MSNEWLTLTEAARLLGVHANTLRRWANNGAVPVHTTPGGHRRFLESELRELVKNHALIPQSYAGRVWADYALVEARHRLHDHTGHPRWQQAFDESEREEKRELGRRLLGLIIQHVANGNGDETLLIEAASIGTRYAQSCLRSGLTTAEGLEATMFFRDALTEVALQMPEVAHISPNDQVRLLRKLNQVFNAVQKSFVDYYDKNSGQPSANQLPESIPPTST